MKKKVFCFDLDNILCKSKTSNYKLSTPIKKNIDVVNKLFEEGHYIKIFTARYMARNRNNVFNAKKQGLNLTKSQLRNWNVNYHELIFGKPSYDIYIDDKSFFFDKSWPKKLSKKYL